MNNVDKIVGESRKSIDIINKCTFGVPEEVAEFFIHYTAVIWDFKMVGTIYDVYSDDITVHREGGSDIVSIDHVISDTLAMLAAFSDLKIVFYNIFAVRDQDEGYRFGQAVYFEGTNDGYSKFGPPTGRKLTKENCQGLCECIVKKVDGRWKIVEEWVTRSSDTVEKVLRGEIDENGNVSELESVEVRDGVCGPL